MIYVNIKCIIIYNKYKRIGYEYEMEQDEELQKEEEGVEMK